MADSMSLIDLELWTAVTSPLVRVTPSLQRMEQVVLEPPGPPKSEKEALGIMRASSGDYMFAYTFYAVSKALRKEWFQVACYVLYTLPDKRRIVALCRDDISTAELVTLHSFAIDVGDLLGIAIADTFFLAVCAPQPTEAELESACASGSLDMGNLSPNPLEVLEGLYGSGQLNIDWKSPGQIDVSRRGSAVVIHKVIGGVYIPHACDETFVCFVCRRPTSRTCTGCNRVAYCSTVCEAGDLHRHELKCSKK